MTKIDDFNFGEWVKASERLPEKDGLVLVYAPSCDDEKPLVTVAWYDPNGFGWSLLPQAWIDAIVAWMPIPEPPLKQSDLQSRLFGKRIFRQITFQGNEYILIGDKSGPIATKEQYKNGLTPYAFLYPEGFINRLGKKIGTIEDITFGDEIEEPMPTEKSRESLRNFRFVNDVE